MSSLLSSCHFLCSRVRNERISAPLNASGGCFTSTGNPLPGTPVLGRRLVVASTDGTGNGPLGDLSATALLRSVHIRVPGATTSRVFRARSLVRTVVGPDSAHLASAGAHLLVLARETCLATTLGERPSFLRRHRGAARGGACLSLRRRCGPASFRGRPATALALGHRGLARFSLRGSLAAALRSLSVDPLVT